MNVPIREMLLNALIDSSLFPHCSVLHHPEIDWNPSSWRTCQFTKPMRDEEQGERKLSEKTGARKQRCILPGLMCPIIVQTSGWIEIK